MAKKIWREEKFDDFSEMSIKRGRGVSRKFIIARWHPKRPKCKKCGNTKRQISRKGTCSVCNLQRNKDVAVQLKNKSGVYYEKWRKAMKRAIEKL